MTLLKHTKSLKLNALYKPLVCCILILSTILSCGCATLFGDNNREINIATVPSGAMVYMNGNGYGKTPTSIVLPHVGYNGQVLVLTKPGYKDQFLNVQTEFQSVGYWNLILFPGFLIDIGTGYMFKIKSKSRDFYIHMENK